MPVRAGISASFGGLRAQHSKGLGPAKRSAQLPSLQLGAHYARSSNRDQPPRCAPDVQTRLIYEACLCGSRRCGVRTGSISSLENGSESGKPVPEFAQSPARPAADSSESCARLSIASDIAPRDCPCFFGLNYLYCMLSVADKAGPQPSFWLTTLGCESTMKIKGQTSSRSAAETDRNLGSCAPRRRKSA